MGPMGIPACYFTDSVEFSQAFDNFTASAEQSGCSVDVENSPAETNSAVLYSSCFCDNLPYGVYGGFEFSEFSAPLPNIPNFQPSFPSGSPSITS